MPVESLVQLDVQVKRSVWLTGEPLLTPVITAEPDWSNGTLALLPPFERLPGSARLRVPDVSVPPLNEPVTPLMSALALPPPSSTRVSAPRRTVLTLSR